MKTVEIVLFFIGVAIGIFLNEVLYVLPKTNLESISHYNAIESKNSRTLDTVPETTVQDVKKIRILCLVFTYPRAHSERAVHVKETWGRHCDKLIFASTLTDVNIGSIGFNVTEGHGYMWTKLKLMLQYVYNNFIGEYDWFLRTDDDTFSIVENVRYLVSAYSPDDPIHFGYKMKGQMKWGWNSGATVVFSRKVVKIFSEKILRDRKNFYSPLAQYLQGACHIEREAGADDIEVDGCFARYNVYNGDSRDPLKRDRVLVFHPEFHIFPQHLGPFLYGRYYQIHEGFNCCSNYVLSSSYIHKGTHYQLYYLSYQLQIYGHKRRHPLPPTKKIFSEVAARLDREVDPKLRGF